MKKTILIAAVFASFCIVSCIPGGEKMDADKNTQHEEEGMHEHEDGSMHDHATDTTHHEDADDHEGHNH